MNYQDNVGLLSPGSAAECLHTRSLYHTDSKLLAKKTQSLIAAAPKSTSEAFPKVSMVPEKNSSSSSLSMSIEEGQICVDLCFGLVHIHL